MGSPTDFQLMTAFAARHAIHPVVSEVYDLKVGLAAFGQMESGSQFGKIVIRTSS